ncbi:MAG: hypothetical protein L0I87_08840 [Corynebacterium casei]|nr:hypothetical protein [Corynebacterium casei]
MSNPNQSSDKLPREIYMRRRIAAFVVILVVVVGLLIAFSAFGGNNDDETAAPESTPVSAPENSEDEGAGSEGSEEIESESAEPSAANDEEANRDQARDGESEESSNDSNSSNIDPALADKDSCELSDLVIRASSDATTYPNGVQPNFGMTVVNPTGADCDINLDEETLRFEVYRISDNQRMWTDTDCYDSVQTGTYSFLAGEERSFDAVWSRLASERGGDCGQRPVVEPGAYFLHTVIGDNASEPYTFNLA